MTEWLDVSVYALLMVSVFIVVPAAAARYTSLFLDDRNAEWLRTHPELARKLGSTGVFRAVSAAWALAGLALLVAFQLDLWPNLFGSLLENGARWEALKDLNAMLLIPGAFAMMLFAALSARHVNRVVPLARRRQAVLARRTLDDFVPRPIQHATYALTAMVVGAWLFAAATNAYSTPKFWGRFVFLIILCGAFAFFVRVGVTRPPHVMDRMFGPAFRAGEVRFAFAQQLLPPVIGSLRLYEEVSNTVLVDVNRAMHLGVALLVTAWALRLGKLPSNTDYSAGNRGTTGATVAAVERREGGDRPLLQEKSMNRAIRATVLAIVMLVGGIAAQTQKLDGQWQGTLEVGQSLRLVFVITSNAAGGGLSGTLHSIDQGGGGLAATVVAQGDNVRLGVAPAGITFEGKVSADGNSIVGTFTQGPGKLPLTLTRASKDTAWAIPAPPKSMAADAPTVFEVATIKPSKPGAGGLGITMRGREVLTVNSTLNDLISFAYSLHARQIIGGPSWLASERFDVVGRPQAEGIPNDRQIRAHIRTLIENRFALVTHLEKRELPAYVLTVMPGGPKMTKNDTNPGGLPGIGFMGLGNMGIVNATMGDLASAMQQLVLDRPVVDRTGIQGRYDFTLRWTPDDSQFRTLGVPIPPAPTDPNAPPGLFTAIQEQLGLKLESTNAPVEVLVIDKVDKPSEN